jgi:hypothetical protein
VNLNPSLVHLLGGRELFDALRTILSDHNNFVTRSFAGGAHFALHRLGSALEEVEHSGSICTIRAGAVGVQTAASVEAYSS